MKIYVVDADVFASHRRRSKYAPLVRALIDLPRDKALKVRIMPNERGSARWYCYETARKGNFRIRIKGLRRNIFAVKKI